MTLTTRQLRATFDVTHRDTEGYRSYDVRCLRPDCDWEAKAWDWRRNALGAGYQHALDHDDTIELVLPDTLPQVRHTLILLKTTLGPLVLDKTLTADEAKPHRERLDRILAEIDRLIEERY